MTDWSVENGTIHLNDSLSFLFLICLSFAMWLAALLFGTDILHCHLIYISLDHVCVYPKSSFGFSVRWYIKPEKTSGQHSNLLWPSNVSKSNRDKTWADAASAIAWLHHCCFPDHKTKAFSLLVWSHRWRSYVIGSQLFWNLHSLEQKQIDK